MYNFNFVDKELTKKYTKLESISLKTLISYAEKLTEKIENKIKNYLPEKIGLIIDGWSNNIDHFLAIFAIYTKNNIKKTPLYLSHSN